jgi:transcriptional regulator with XRE-family HTH domain
MERNVVGPRVRRARKNMRPAITQGELAARLQVMGLEVNQATISKIEKQLRPVLDVEVLALAKALGVTPAWLFEAEDRK